MTAHVDYVLLNLTAYRGTVDEFKELLFNHGDDKNAMIAIVSGLDGESAEGLSYRLPNALHETEKRAALASFRGQQNEFSPNSIESKLKKAYDKASTKVDKLTERNTELEKEVARLKSELAQKNSGPGWQGH